MASLLSLFLFCVANKRDKSAQKFCAIRSQHCILSIKVLRVTFGFSTQFCRVFLLTFENCMGFCVSRYIALYRRKFKSFLPLAVPESFRHHIRTAKSEVRSLCTLYANCGVKSNLKTFFLSRTPIFLWQSLFCSTIACDWDLRYNRLEILS